MGNRVCKIEKPYNLTSTGWKYTFYVRDASGNIMTTYTKTGSEIENNVLKLDEVMLYGSSRIGTREVNVLLSGLTIPTTTFSRALGLKRYEIGNHLGNVLATFTDRKKQVQSGSSVTGYETYIASAQDYYPFGMIMNERKWNTSSYRFGFQKQEVDNEIWGGAASFKYRISDTRIGRFFSIDPLTAKYPWNSPYSFSENRVIDGIELEGKEVLLLGIQGSVNCVVGMNSETGVMIAPNGVYLYESFGGSIASNVSTSAVVSVTFYGAMPTAQDAEGWGYSGGFSFGEGISIGVNAATTGDYDGINYQVGVGVGLIPIQAQVEASYTWIKPISSQAQREQARHILQKTHNILTDKIYAISNSISKINKNNQKLKLENLKLEQKMANSNETMRMKYKSKINENNEKIDENINEGKKLEVERSELQDKKRSVEKSIDKL